LLRSYGLLLRQQAIPLRQLVLGRSAPRAPACGFRETGERAPLANFAVSNDLPLLNHLIISEGGYYRFKDKGEMGNDLIPRSTVFISKYYPKEFSQNGNDLRKLRVFLKSGDHVCYAGR
jgi:hypothetical protein